MLPKVINKLKYVGHCATRFSLSNKLSLNVAKGNQQAKVCWTLCDTL
jgi:hypothetical protein